MADYHSGDAANSCPQPWSFLPGLSIIPWSQWLKKVLNGASKVIFPPSCATCHPSVSRHDAGSQRFLCHPAITHPVSIWPGREQFATFSSRGAWWSDTLLCDSVSQCTPCARLQDQAHWYPAGLWSLRALARIPWWTAAAVLWTFAFPILKLKTRHTTNLRAPKISGGKYYWEQKPGRLFSRAWLFFQSVLASIFFPSAGIFEYWET